MVSSNTTSYHASRNTHYYQKAKVTNEVIKSLSSSSPSSSTPTKITAHHGPRSSCHITSTNIKKHQQPSGQVITTTTINSNNTLDVSTATTVAVATTATTQSRSTQPPPRRRFQRRNSKTAHMLQAECHQFVSSLKFASDSGFEKSSTVLSSCSAPRPLYDFSSNICNIGKNKEEEEEDRIEIKIQHLPTTTSKLCKWVAASSKQRQLQQQQLPSSSSSSSPSLTIIDAALYALWQTKKINDQRAAPQNESEEEKYNYYTITTKRS